MNVLGLCLDPVGQAQVAESGPGELVHLGDPADDEVEPVGLVGDPVAVAAAPGQPKWRVGSEHLLAIQSAAAHHLLGSPPAAPTLTSRVVVIH